MKTRILMFVLLTVLGLSLLGAGFSGWRWVHGAQRRTYETTYANSGTQDIIGIPLRTDDCFKKVYPDSCVFPNNRSATVKWLTASSTFEVYSLYTNIRSTAGDGITVGPTLIEIEPPTGTSNGVMIGNTDKTNVNNFYGALGVLGLSDVRGSATFQYTTNIEATDAGGSFIQLVDGIGDTSNWIGKLYNDGADFCLEFWDGGVVPAEFASICGDNANSEIDVVGDVTMANDLDVSGDVAITLDLTVNGGDLTLGSDLAMAGGSLIPTSPAIVAATRMEKCAGLNASVTGATTGYMRDPGNWEIMTATTGIPMGRTGSITGVSWSAQTNGDDSCDIDFECRIGGVVKAAHAHDAVSSAGLTQRIGSTEQVRGTTFATDTHLQMTVTAEANCVATYPIICCEYVYDD